MVDQETVRKCVGVEHVTKCSRCLKPVAQQDAWVVGALTICHPCMEAILIDSVK
jgi:formylmethanofuran dehydrogenase subunit E